MKQIFSQLGPGVRHAVTLVGLDGIFWFAWAFGCYQSIYLQSIGFSASQLGLLNAVSSGVGIASVAFWGMVSDRIGSLRRILIILLVVGASLYALVPLVPTGLSVSPWLLTIFIPALNFFRSSQSTFAENMLVRNCNELRLNFGVLRSAGSILFTVGSLLMSFLLPHTGVRSTFLISGVLMIPVVVFTVLAREPNARPVGSPVKGQKLDVSPLFHSRPYVMLLVFAFFYSIAVSCEGNFLPYYMSSLGLPSERYGVVMGYRALLEVPFLLLMVRLRRRFSLRKLVAAAATLMSVECLGFGLLTGGFPTMLLFCTFFGLGNGLFIGSSLNYVYELAPDNLKASAQAFYTSICSVAGILGNLLGGVVFDAIGARPFYLVTAGMYLLSVAIFLLSFLEKKKKFPAA